ncbi:MAG: ABC transporter permease, partial [Gemmatimonadetes bacterium]|nr:ABC transporter permease [Gemmatimonadota bacterium]
GEGYFSSLGIPILAGRGFEARDGLDDAPEVIIVSESFARRHWPGESAVGKQVARTGGPLAEALWHEVVGVVGEVHNAGYGRPSEPAIYFPMEQITWSDVFLMARTAGDPRGFLEEIREVVWGIDRNIPLSQFGTLEQEILRENWQVPTFSWAFGLISVIALILASTGVYGIMAYAVSLRSREFALRIAVGAEPRSLKGRVIRGALLVAGSGIVLGVGFSLVGTRFLRDLLFRVSPTDFGVYGISIGIMIVVAVTASYLPARKATRLEPMSVLNRE